jgi:hypothetical protein
MVKRVSLILLFAGIAGLLGWLYYYAKKATEPSTPAIQAVPSTAAFIIETKNLQKSWKKISTNAIWKQLLNIEQCRHFNKYITTIDSSLNSSTEMLELIRKQPSFICFHLTEKKNCSFLLLVNIPTNTKKDYLQKLLGQIIPQEEDMPHYFFSKGILGISYSDELINLSQNVLNSKNAINTDKDFSKIMFTAGKKIDENVFINYPALADLIRGNQQKENESIRFLQNLARFSSLDVKMDSTYLSLVGYSTGDESSGFLQILKNTSAQGMVGIKYLPNSLQHLTYFGIKDFAGFRNALLNFNSDTTSKTENGEKDFEFINSWMGSEIINFSFLNESQEKRSAVLCKLKYPENSEKNIVDLFNQQTVKDQIKHRGKIIRKYDEDDLWTKVMGKKFALSGKPYFCFIDDYIFFAENVPDLRDLINCNFNGLTLKKTESFIAFSENISAQANYFFCYKNNKENEYLRELLSYTNYKTYQKNHSALKKLSYSGFVLNANKNLYFTQFHSQFNFNPVKQPKSIKIDFEYMLAGDLKAVKNSGGQTKYVGLQDEKNTLFIFDLAGKKIFEAPLKESINSDIFVTDEAKKVFVFNGNNFLYALNEEGIFLRNFPVKLKSPASSPLSFFDYDNKKEYRLIIGLENKKVYNYNLEGALVDGWKLETEMDKISSPIKYFVVNGTGYLIMVDTKNIVRICGRHNEKVIQFKTRPEYFFRKQFFVELGATMEKSCVVMSDTSGKVCRLFFGGKTETDMLSASWGNDHFFIAADICDSEAKEYLIASGNKLNAFNADGDLLFETTFEEEIQSLPQVFEMDNGTFISVNLKNSEQTFLLDHKGQRVLPNSIYTRSDIALALVANQVLAISHNGKSLNYFSIK